MNSNFWKGYAAWTFFACAPPLVLYLHTHLFRKGDLLFFLPFLLIPIVGCSVLWVSLFKVSSLWVGTIAGLLLGIAIPVLGSFAWMRIFPGFESRSAIFLGALMITVPSAVGGGIAGWFQAQSAQGGEKPKN